MSRLRARMALSAYRWAGVMAYPAISAFVALRTARGKEDRARKSERYGYASAPRPEGPLVWVHAASVGETNAMVPLIKEISRRGITVLLTTGTVSSAAIARSRLESEVIHQYVPLDLAPVVRRFLQYWQPELALFAESEIWPTTILELGHRHIPHLSPLVEGKQYRLRAVRKPRIGDRPIGARLRALSGVRRSAGACIGQSQGR